MAKAPKSTPETGDRVVLRGRGNTGTLSSVNANLWARVDWDDDGPKFCHLHELAKAD
uniref:Uncharacterized protein n=1 Tax=Aquisalinus luteolus TaxID=1566827 RepID=A0A8J3A8L9_9PROT|nr:hypothetical protein GCM10011355_27200 [Aquisalinus luteolus]